MQCYIEMCHSLQRYYISVGVICNEYFVMWAWDVNMISIYKVGFAYL